MRPCSARRYLAAVTHAVTTATDHNVVLKYRLVIPNGSHSEKPLELKIGLK